MEEEQPIEAPEEAGEGAQLRVLPEAQEMSFQHAEKDQQCQLLRGGQKDNGFKVSNGFSNKTVIDDLAESSFSRVIRAEARLQWAE